MARLLEKIRTQLKNHADWWTDYMTEMSILVISLAATFYGENLIESYNEAQEDKTTMELVVQELNYDMEELAEMKKQYESEVNFSKALNSVLVQKVVLPQDSLDTYKNFHRISYFWALKLSAFDFVKVSGTMQRVEDKELVVQLFECYELMNIIKELNKRFIEERRANLSTFTEHLTDSGHGNTVQEQWEQINRDASYKHYLLYTLGPAAKNVNIQITGVMENISETIQKIKADYKID